MLNKEFFFLFRTPSESNGYFVSHGILYNKNTIEDFKNCDKAALMNEEGRKIWESIRNGSCIENPSLFVRFFVLSFAVSKYLDFLPNTVRPAKQNSFFFSNQIFRT